MLRVYEDDVSRTQENLCEQNGCSIEHELLERVPNNSWAPLPAVAH